MNVINIVICNLESITFSLQLIVHNEDLNVQLGIVTWLKVFYHYGLLEYQKKKKLRKKTQNKKNRNRE